MRRVSYYLIFVLFSLLLFSCKPVERVVEVERVKTEYITKVDSVIVNDSVVRYIERKGDTVYDTKEKVVVKRIVSRDTLRQIDTIPIIKTVTITKVVEVNKLKQWQLYLIICGVIGIAYIILKIVWRIKR
jgi:hypothetical protein